MLTHVKYCMETREGFVPVDDGEDIYFVNTVVRDGSDKSELLQLFLRKDVFEETKFPELSWKVDDKKGSAELMEDVIEGKLDYTIADSVAISLFQRVHPELAVALDITDEQPVTWFSPLDGDNTLSAALLDFFNEMNEDGTLARIEEKYLGHGDDFDYVDTRTFLRAVDAVLPSGQTASCSPT